MHASTAFPLSLVFIAGWLYLGPLLTGGVAAASPLYETRAVFNDEAGNLSDADDPAIWVNAADPGRSLVVGTLKRGGLDVYDLRGSLVQHIAADAAPAGTHLRAARYNNVDIIYRFNLGPRVADLAVVTDRHNDLLRFFVIDPKALAEGKPPLSEITSPNVPRIFTPDVEELKSGRTAYGLAVTQVEPARETADAFVSRAGRTTVARARIFAEDGKASYLVAAELNLPDRFSLPDGGSWSPCQEYEGDGPQVEGMVVDDFHKVLYLAQERVGIWKLAIDQPSAPPALVDRVRAFGVPFERVLLEGRRKHTCQPKWEASPGVGSDYLSADVEGLTLYDMGEGKGYLLASSQGTNSFVVYDRVSGAFIGAFAIGGGVIDGSEQCDGAHVVSDCLSAELSEGLLVVQDGRNTPEILDQSGPVRDSTNFKFIRWTDVARSLGLTVRKGF